MEYERFDCVWDAIEDTPEKAAEMRRRSFILIGMERGEALTYPVELARETNGLYRPSMTFPMQPPSATARRTHCRPREIRWKA